MASTTAHPDDDAALCDPEALADLARRLQRFDASKDPSWLWPGLSEPARVRAAQEIQRVTAEMLRGMSRVQMDPQRHHETYALAIAAHTTGMGPLLGHWILTGRLSAEPAVEARMRAHLEHSRRRNARIERELHPALDALIRHGVVPVALKGLHTSRAYFEDPAARRMADVDIWVDERLREAAEEALRSAEFRPSGTPTEAHKQEWIAVGIDDTIHSVEVADAYTKWELELHTSLVRVFHRGAVAKLDPLLLRTEPFELAGVRMRVLQPDALIIMLACHCSAELGSSRLLRLYEIVSIVRSVQMRDGLDWDGILAQMASLRVAHYTYPAFVLAEALAPGTIDPRALALGERASTWAARHTVARLTPAGGVIDEIGFLRQVMWVRGVDGFLHRIQRLVWPAPHGRPTNASASWRTRMRQFRAGLLSLRAPNERRWHEGTNRDRA
ncbi:MAG: nucleotidyltransferase family protein [Gemmatimonadota bacterium]